MLRVQTVHGGAFIAELEAFGRYFGLVCVKLPGGELKGLATCQPMRSKQQAIGSAFRNRPDLPTSGQPVLCRHTELTFEQEHKNGRTIGVYKTLLVFEPGRIYMGLECIISATEMALLEPECPTCRAKPGVRCKGYENTGPIIVTHTTRSSQVKGDETSFRLHTFGPDTDFGRVSQLLYGGSQLAIAAS